MDPFTLLLIGSSIALGATSLMQLKKGEDLSLSVIYATTPGEPNSFRASSMLDAGAVKKLAQQMRLKSSDFNVESQAAGVLDGSQMVVFLADTSNPTPTDGGVAQSAVATYSRGTDMLWRLNEVLLFGGESSPGGPNNDKALYVEAVINAYLTGSPPPESTQTVPEPQPQQELASRVLLINSPSGLSLAIGENLFNQEEVWMPPPEVDQYLADSGAMDAIAMTWEESPVITPGAEETLPALVDAGFRGVEGVFDASIEDALFLFSPSSNNFVGVIDEEADLFIPAGAGESSSGADFGSMLDDVNQAIDQAEADGSFLVINRDIDSPEELAAVVEGAYEHPMLSQTELEEGPEWYLEDPIEGITTRERAEEVLDLIAEVDDEIDMGEAVELSEEAEAAILGQTSEIEAEALPPLGEEELGTSDS